MKLSFDFDAVFKEFATNLTKLRSERINHKVEIGECGYQISGQGANKFYQFNKIEKYKEEEIFCLKSLFSYVLKVDHLNFPLITLVTFDSEEEAIKAFKECLPMQESQWFEIRDNLKHELAYAWLKFGNLTLEIKELTDYGSQRHIELIMESARLYEEFICPMDQMIKDFELFLNKINVKE